LIRGVLHNIAPIEKAGFMIKTSFAVCGFRVLVDANENRASIVDVLDDFHIQQFPVVLPRLSALWVLTRAASDPTQMEASVNVTLNGKLLQAIPLNIGFGDQLRARAVIAVNDLQIDAPGELAFNFQRKGDPQATVVVASQVYSVPAQTRQ
jgi:hypothetical protein